MRITFEDEGAQVVLDLPDVKLRHEYRIAKGTPHYFGLDPQTEILAAVTQELFWRLTLGVPHDNGKLAIRQDVDVDTLQLSSKLLAEICNILVKIDPGAPVSFWEMRKK